ncbi:Protein of unknown function [Pyronema omphalodes CBS 100304]|uniref:Uncharacterized protein n=1 Tax=Pyronema omphalodes (strain CBS 100304) TaxID=1076935 RepID=U4LEG5_PYROM|nr:Protein of unknown function [Pyronema omphalodes CBS 100304]
MGFKTRLSRASYILGISVSIFLLDLYFIEGCFQQSIAITPRSTGFDRVTEL